MAGPGICRLAGKGGGEHHFINQASGADAYSQANNFPQAHQLLYDWFDEVLG